MKRTLKAYGRWILGGFFILAGLNHFANPEPYLAMMPSWLPAPRTLVWISGLAEILGGVAVYFRFFRELAGWYLILLLIAIFPANINVALNGWPGVSLPAWVLWGRLPLQFVLIAWIYRICIHGQLSPGLFVTDVKEVRSPHETRR